MNLKELLEFIVRALVDVPEEVEVCETPGDGAQIFEIFVAQDDIGKVIGREGRIANSLRTICKAAAAKTGQRVAVEILTRQELEERQTADSAA